MDSEIKKSPVSVSVDSKVKGMLPQELKREPGGPMPIAQRLLNVAAQHGHASVVRLLVNAGAELTAQDPPKIYESPEYFDFEDTWVDGLREAARNDDENTVILLREGKDGPAQALVDAAARGAYKDTIE